MRPPGWGALAAGYMHASLSATSWSHYARALGHFLTYCRAQECVPPSESDLADFLAREARRATMRRPQQWLSQVKQGVHYYCRIVGLPDITQGRDLARLITALVRAETKAPASHPRAFVAELPTLIGYLRRWAPEGFAERLRKAMALLAIAGMCRAADMADLVMRRRFTTTSRAPRAARGGAERAALQINMLGHKNDASRRGAVLQVQQAADPAVCPVRHVTAFIAATRGLERRWAPHECPVFMNEDGSAVSKQQARAILVRVLRDAGITDPAVTARCYRTTAATSYYLQRLDADEILRLGRWSSKGWDMVRRHYVHEGRTRESVIDAVARREEEEEEGIVEEAGPADDNADGNVDAGARGGIDDHEQNVYQHENSTDEGGASVDEDGNSVDEGGDSIDEYGSGV